MLGLWTFIKGSRVAQLALVALTLGALVLMVDRCARRVMDTATEGGKQTERADSLQDTFRQTERANNAAENIRRNPDARRADCLRDSRTPENC